MEVRPRLSRPHAPVLHRPDGSLQLGVGPAALHLHAASTQEAAWLSSLDGTRSLPSALAEAEVRGIDRHRAATLVDGLAAEGHLTLTSNDVPGGGRVVVAGCGALPALLADVLAHAGAGEVSRLRHGPVVRDTVDLLVLVTREPPSLDEVSGRVPPGTPLLPVVGASTHASVGPVLHVPGGPCMQCLELTRAALDPAWPWLRAQLSPVRVAADRPVDGQADVRLLAAGLATHLALDHLSGRGDGPGWAFDVAVPGPTFERRRWPVHPACPRCTATSSPLERPDPSPARRLEAAG